jgi:hypothetical protein
MNTTNGVFTRSKRAPKYNNKAAQWRGEQFDSQAECRRFQALVQLVELGVIRSLVRQPSFALAPKAIVGGKTKRALTYRADFGYTLTSTGKAIVEDVKGCLTDVYKIKRHLMVTVHGIDIMETR